MLWERIACTRRRRTEAPQSMVQGLGQELVRRRNLFLQIALHVRQMNHRTIHIADRGECAAPSPAPPKRRRSGGREIIAIDVHHPEGGKGDPRPPRFAWRELGSLAPARYAAVKTRINLGRDF